MNGRNQNRDLTAYEEAMSEFLHTFLFFRGGGCWVRLSVIAPADASVQAAIRSARHKGLLADYGIALVGGWVKLLPGGREAARAEEKRRRSTSRAGSGGAA